MSFYFERSLLHMYQSHLRLPFAPDEQLALEHFQTVSRGELPTAKHPLLQTYFTWLAAHCSTDRTNYMAQGRPQGALEHICVVHGWRNEDVQQTSQVPTSRRAASSNTNIGSCVDEELQKLHRGELRTLDGCDDYTRWIVLYFFERHWLPLALQVPIWCQDKSVRTCADIIIYDLTTKRFALIEQKTGYDNNYKFVRYPRTETNFFDRTYENECHLQLGWMYFELDRAQHPWPLDAYVMRVGRIGVRKPEPLLPDVAAYYRNQHRADNTQLPHLGKEEEEEDDESEETLSDVEEPEEEADEDYADEESGGTSIDENRDTEGGNRRKRQRATEEDE